MGNVNFSIDSKENPFSPYSPNEVLMPRIGYTVLSIIMAVVSIPAIILNVTVIVVTLRHKKLRQPLNYALVNLAVADLGVALTGGLITVVTNSMGYFSLGRIGCVIEGFSVSFFGITALCTVAVIAVERFFVVCKPLGSIMFRTKHAVAAVAFAWVWSLIWNTPPLFGWGSYQPEGVKTSCAPNWYSRDPWNISYILCYFLLCFAIPFIIIVISYSQLLWEVRQVMVWFLLLKVARLHTSEGRTIARVEVQVARMVIMMVLAFLLTWLPYAAFALAVIIDHDLHISPIVSTVPMYLAKSSTIFNPIIYIFMNKQFRNYAVPFLLCGRNPWASASEGLEEDTTISTVSKSPKVSPA